MTFDETSLGNTLTATHDSWLARLVAFVAWLFDAIAKLRRVRRTTRFAPAWRDHFDDLRQLEWHRAQWLAQGAALLLSGKTLDDADYEHHPMPAEFGGPCPATPFEMNRRFLAITLFMRAPETHIRRHAARIAKRVPAAAQSLNTHKQLTLMVSSTRSVRPSNHAGELRSQLNARGPPRLAEGLLIAHPHALAA